jgi:serine/threonine-protein kinase
MLLAQGFVLEGKYRIERLLGAGGMGTVWVAEHTGLQRPVAIKVLDSASASRDPSAVQRFLREAQTAARIRNEHIVDVIDVGRFDDADGTPFLVMELLEGETLTSRIRRSERLSQRDAADFVDQLLSALAAAHEAGVIHRDIKPDNCFLTKKQSKGEARDHLKLLDFGISKVAGDPREMRMTKTGVVMGTPYYMAPEQARGGKQLDHRCDLYSVGAILYECVTGRIPFEAENVNELLFKIVLEQPALPRSIAPELEPAFEGVILQAMAREPDARFQSAVAFRDALAPFLEVGARTSVPSLSDRAGSLPPSNPAASSGRGDRAVFRTPSTEPVTGIGDTRPMSSDPPPAPPTVPTILPAGPPTPSGLQALSSSGPVQASIPPAAGRNGALYAAAAFAILAVTGGGLYLATTRAPQPAHAPPATHETEGNESAARAGAAEANAASAKPGRAPLASEEPSSTVTNAAPAAPSASQGPRASATPPTRVAPSVTTTAGATTARKPPPITTVAPPAVTAPPKAPAPTASGPGTITPPRNSPRPIDTQL